MSTRLDSTHGAAFIGMVVAAILYGISCVQALYYFIDQNNDPWYIQLMVTAVMTLDTVHQAFISHTVYTYTITDWGDSVQSGLIAWTFVGEVLVTGVTAFIVQSFLTMRIWRLSNRNIYITGICMILVTSAFVTLIITLAKMLQFTYLADIVKIKRGLFISVSALHAAADILIAATLCALLNGFRTGLQKSEIIINRLILYAVNTGLITSFCALASLITLVAVSHTFINIAFFFCLGRLYTNTLLASLNARKHIRDLGGIEPELEDIPISLQDLSTSRSNQHQIYPSTSTPPPKNTMTRNSILRYHDEESPRKMSD